MAFRDEVRTFFREKVPAGHVRQKLIEGRHAKEDMRAAADPQQEGLGRAVWPKEYGGTGWTPTAAIHLRGGVRGADAAPLAVRRRDGRRR